MLDIDPRTEVSLAGVEQEEDHREQHWATPEKYDISMVLNHYIRCQEGNAPDYDSPIHRLWVEIDALDARQAQNWNHQANKGGR